MTLALEELDEKRQGIAKNRAESMVVGWIHSEAHDADRTMPAAFALMIFKAASCACCIDMMLATMTKHGIKTEALRKTLDPPEGVEPLVWHDQVDQAYRNMMSTSFAYPKEELS